MKLNRLAIAALLIFTTLVSCKDEFLDTLQDSSIPTETALESPEYFLGFLYNTYTGLPTRANFDYEAATDNAVVNREVFSSSKAAKGGISATNNPLGEVWENDFLQINSLNWFLEHMVLDYSKPIPTPVRFDLNPEINMEIFKMSKGEAYFLRAWYQFDLLQKYGGVAADGKAYGFPINTRYLTVNDDLDLPRNTYEECVAQIVADCDSAFLLLPLNYTKSNGTVGEGLMADAGRASGLAALALKARALLYKASPAYNVNNKASYWDEAAKAAAAAIQAAGADELMPLSAYYNKNNLNDANYTNPDLFFRGPIRLDDQTLEKENFPPRAFGGKGKFNPSQNLVDAFPMSDGYPINMSPNFYYDESTQYMNRDPRLDNFVVRPGETFAKIIIESHAGGADAYGSDQNATRTGYYLQKFLDPMVSLEPGKLVKTIRAAYLLGRPELYLNFAEAAVIATGNLDDTRYGFSAREILAKVRNRALGAGNDLYLPTVTDKDEFLELVRNERRIELCFEDFRFWDLRRWSTGVNDKSLINIPAYGIYSDSPVETRQFASPYMPLPYAEMIKASNLVNNAGW